MQSTTHKLLHPNISVFYMQTRMQTCVQALQAYPDRPERDQRDTVL